MAVNAEWHHSRSSDLSFTPHLSEYGVIGCASTEAPSNNSQTFTLFLPTQRAEETKLQILSHPSTINELELFQILQIT